MPQSALAQVALTAGQDRVDHHALAPGPRSRELVSHDQRWFAESRAPDAVQFAAADTSCPDMHEDFAVGYLRLSRVE